MIINAIGGMAGVGKTTLAIHLAHRVADRYRDGQLYVDLRGFDLNGSAMTPAEAIRGFLENLGVSPQQIPDGLDAQAALYRSFLADRRMLVLLDNARDAEQVRPLLPGSAGCLVLITSRNQLSSLVAAHGAHPLALDVMSTESARESLVRRLGADRVDAEPEATQTIISLCGRLPLALSVITARALMNPRLPLGAMAEQLLEAKGSLDAFEGADRSTDIRAVFGWSYRTLSDDTARLFRLLSLHPGATFDVHSAAALGGLTVRRTRPSLAELVRAHLVAEEAGAVTACTTSCAPTDGRRPTRTTPPTTGMRRTTGCSGITCRRPTRLCGCWTRPISSPSPPGSGRPRPPGRPAWKPRCGGSSRNASR